MPHSHLNYQTLPASVLLLHEFWGVDNATGHALDDLLNELKRRSISVRTATTPEDACVIVNSDVTIQAYLLGWEPKPQSAHPTQCVLDTIRSRNTRVPVFLITVSSEASMVPLKTLQELDDFIGLFEDTTNFIGGRIAAAIDRYRATILPPMFKALANFSQIYEYSWHTPGHTGGTAFLKSPVGRAFFEFYGERLFRTDLSISVGALGSLLDHSGPIGESEKYAARVFGAHRTYHVTNGSSTSNRVILMASVTRDQVCLCDRNCHKSVEHAMIMSGAVPVWMMPVRNAYGIIGPITPDQLTPESIKTLISKNKLISQGIDLNPKHAIITNSTYDGLCYNIRRVESLLGKSVDRLQYDEAWYGYARFNPIYKDRYGMYGNPIEHDTSRPTVFATQSTHKLLAALSQASFIHVRDGRNPIEHERFNESFMMHSSTSPNYAIIASNDVAAGMMNGSAGEALTTDAIVEAVAFRRMLARVHAEFLSKGDWFFSPWQPSCVHDPESKNVVPFYLADEDMLVKNPECWMLEPNDDWHGFGEIEKNYCMLDPIKVTVLTPGVSPKEGLMNWGIPATILATYLEHNGIIVEKTSDFGVLLLFSMGITKGKWGTFMNTLLEFKRDYDANISLEIVLPEILKEHGNRYFGYGLKDLCNEMFSKMGQLKTTEYLARGFAVLPQPELSPVRAYEELVRNNIEKVNLENLANRIVATGLVPYPPGIPILMPGENAGAANGPILTYLKSLEQFDRTFPGFTHDTHGVEVENFVWYVSAIKCQF